MPIIPIIRSGGPKPSGKIEITNNGTGIDVSQYAEADVAVPASAVVSGTKSITANGTNIDVTNYAAVDVAVPATSWQGTVTIVNNTGNNLTVYVAKEGQNLIDTTLLHNGDSAQISMPCNSYTSSGHTYLHVGGVFYVKRAGYTSVSNVPNLKVTASGSPLVYDPVIIKKANGQYIDYVADVIMIKELTTAANYKSVTYTLTEEEVSS